MAMVVLAGFIPFVAFHLWGVKLMPGWFKLASSTNVCRQTLGAFVRHGRGKATKKLEFCFFQGEARSSLTFLRLFPEPPLPSRHGLALEAM